MKYKHMNLGHTNCVIVHQILTESCSFFTNLLQAYLKLNSINVNLESFAHY